MGVITTERTVMIQLSPGGAGLKGYTKKFRNSLQSGRARMRRAALCDLYDFVAEYVSQPERTVITVLTYVGAPGGAIFQFTGATHSRA